MRTLKIVPGFKPRVYLIAANGESTEYKNIDEAARHLDGYFLSRHVGTHFNEITPRDCLADFVLRSELGDIITPAEVLAARKARVARRSRWVNLPLSGRKYARYCWLRHPRTTQERCWADAWKDEDFAPRTRARRNARNLPNAWDDVHRDVERSWKRYRKAQWK